MNSLRFSLGITSEATSSSLLAYIFVETAAQVAVCFQSVPRQGNFWQRLPLPYSVKACDALLTTRWNAITVSWQSRHKLLKSAASLTSLAAICTCPVLWLHRTAVGARATPCPCSLVLPARSAGPYSVSQTTSHRFRFMGIFDSAGSLAPPLTLSTVLPHTAVGPEPFSVLSKHHGFI